MSVGLEYTHIEKIEGEPARLRQSPRVRVAQVVMDYLAHGWSVDEMCRQHPNLSPAEAHAAMAYYFDHREEIDQEIESEFQEVDESLAHAGAVPFVIRMKSKGLL
jgi:uncharacterized protein (DUF433 family)